MHHLSYYSHTEGTYWLDFFQSPSDVLVPVLINNCSSSSSVLCLLLHPVTFSMWGVSPGELWTQSALPHPGLCSLLHLHPQHQESALRGLCKNSFCSQFPQLELQQVGILGRLWEGEPHRHDTTHCWWLLYFLFNLIFFYSGEDVSILRSIGLVKHPQVMSCIYISLFLLTMLIIAQQVIKQ